MHNSVIMKLDQDDDYWMYLRENPLWQIRLSRHPEDYPLFLQEYKKARRKRVIDRLEDFSMMMSLAKEFM